MSIDSKKILDCVVVGAGFSGVAAARLLHQAGCDFVLCEARERIGGRTLTAEIGDGIKVDLGGQWIGPGMDRIYSLAKQYATPLVATHDSGMRVWEDGGRVTPFAGPSLPLSREALAELGTLRRKIDALARSVNARRPSETLQAELLDRGTVSEWLDGNVEHAESRRTLDFLFRAQLSTEPDTISMLQALFFFGASGKSVEYLSSYSGGALQDRFSFGTASLLEKMIEPFRAKIRLKCEVAVIEQTDSGVRVRTTAGTFEAKHVIVAIPPVLISGIRFEPGLPTERGEFFGSFFMGKVVKAIALYETPFWKERGFSGRIGSTSSEFFSVCDNSPAHGTKGVLLGLSVGARASRLSGMTVQERRARFHEHLTKAFGKDAGSMLHYQDVCWENEPWSRGGYSSLLPPGVLSRCTEFRARPEGRIHFAGAETAREWVGFMEGALEAGERAALEVVAA